MKKTASLFLALTLVLSLTLPVSAAEETSYPVLEGGVQEIQKYGNLVLDIDPADVEKGGYTYAYVKAMDSAKALPSANIHFQDADAMLTDMLTELAQGGDVAEILAKWQTQIQNEYNK